MSKGYEQSKVISEFTEFRDQISFTDACAEIKIQNSTLRRLEKLYQYIESVNPVSSKLKIHHLLDRVVWIVYNNFIDGQCYHAKYHHGVKIDDLVGRKIKAMHNPPNKCEKCDGHGMVADG